ncbi:MAG: hypothetical protein H5U02_09990 [Clostridia bacterium]|nr:hypothetical protein [Clostridia bacterium]
MAKVYRRIKGTRPKALKRSARYLVFSQGSGYVATDYRFPCRPLAAPASPPLILIDTSNPSSAQDPP